MIVHIKKIIVKHLALFTISCFL